MKRTAKTLVKLGWVFVVRTSHWIFCLAPAHLYTCTYTKVSYNSWANTFIFMFTIFQTLVHLLPQTNEHFVEIENFSIENIFRFEKRQLLKISIIYRLKSFMLIIISFVKSSASNLIDATQVLHFAISLVIILFSLARIPLMDVVLSFQAVSAVCSEIFLSAFSFGNKVFSVSHVMRNPVCGICNNITSIFSRQQQSGFLLVSYYL